MQSPKITIEELSLTPTELARKLKENPEALLKELKEEKGIFEDTMEANTVLAWDTIQRACERRGYEAVDSYKQNKETANTLTHKEKEALKQCVSFHRMYAELIVDSLPKNPSNEKASSKLAEYHQDISQTINNVLEKVLVKEKPTKQAGLSLDM
jgi:hypothetical protein